MGLGPSNLLDREGYGSLGFFIAHLKKKQNETAERVTHFLTVQLEELKIIHGPVAPNKKATGFDGWKPRYLQDEPQADRCKWSYMFFFLKWWYPQIIRFPL